MRQITLDPEVLTPTPNAESCRIPSRLCASGVPWKNDSGAQLIWARLEDFDQSMFPQKPSSISGPKDQECLSGLGLFSTCSGLTDTSRWLGFRI